MQKHDRLNNLNEELDDVENKNLFELDSLNQIAIKRNLYQKQLLNSLSVKHSELTSLEVNLNELLTE